VNCRSLSFKEGKKVAVVYVPLTWLRSLPRLRLASIDVMREIEFQKIQKLQLSRTSELLPDSMHLKADRKP